MRKQLNIALGLVVCAFLSGCTTFVDGKRAASGDGDGVEYSLPIPVVRVTPMPDGSIDVQVEMLPDPDNTYRLRTRSYLSSYTLDVSRENGMLKSVSLDAKSDAVAASLLESRANLIKAKAEAEAKEKEAVATSAKEQAKALADAKMELVLATAKRKALEAASAPAADVSAAAVDEAVANAKLEALQTTATDAGKSAFNTAGAVKELPKEALLSAAPVLFRVVPVPDEGSVRLVAFDGARFIQTSSAAKKPEEDKEGKGPALALTLTGDGVLKKGKPLALTVVANRPNLKADLPGSGVQRTGGGDELLAFVQLATPQPDDGKKATIFAVTLKDNIPAGSYRLVLRMVDAQGQPMLADPIDFVVQK